MRPLSIACVLLALYGCSDSQTFVPAFGVDAGSASDVSDGSGNDASVGADAPDATDVGASDVPADGEGDGSASDAGDVQPDAADVGPDAVDVQPDTADVGPDAVDVQPDTADVGPDAVDVGPDAVDVPPDTADAGPDAADTADGSDTVVPTCGDGFAGPGEECDGDDDVACGGAEFAFCDETCMCVDYECGDDVADLGEECDGSDDAACGPTEVCDDTCACVDDAPTTPTLDPFPSDPFAGPSPAVVLAPNLTDDACEAEEPHGYTWRLTGTSSAPISRYDVQIMGVDTTSRPFTVTPTTSGRFTLTHSVCLDAYAEDVNFRFRVFDSRGNVSNPVNLRVPVRAGATLRAFTVAPARDEDLHVLRMSGSAPDHNLEFIRSDILVGATTMAEDFDANIAGIGARYAPDGTYEAIGLISGVEGAGIDRYDGRVVTFGGRESAVRTASVASTTPGSGEPCVPAVDAFTTTCVEGLVCRSSGGPLRGTCRTATGSAPVLTSIVDGRLEEGSEICSDEFPDALLWTMVGTSSEAITGFSIQATEFGPDPFAFEDTPQPGGSFRVETGVCLAGDAPGTVQIRAIDEAGRQSGARSFSP